MPFVKGQKSLAAAATTSAMWMASQTVVSRFVSLAAQLVLAHLLLPEYFGLIALVNTLTLFSRHLINPGIDEVLLQKQSRMNRWLPAAFWFNIVSGIVGAIVLALAGFIVVRVAQYFGTSAYGSPTLFQMILVLAIAYPLDAISLVPRVILRSRLRFQSIAIIDFCEGLLKQGGTILFAYLGLGPFSFVLPMPIVAALRAVVMLVLARPPIFIRLNMYRWSSLIGSTRWVLGQRICRTGRDHGDQMVLGALFNDRAMNGYYYLAFVLSMQIVRMFCENLVQVLIPVLNSMLGNRERLEGATIRTCRALATIVIPLSVCQAVLAGPMIRLVFGIKWSPVIPILQILSLGPILFALTYALTSLNSAMGRFRQAFFLSAFNMLLFFALVTPLAHWKMAVGAALGVMIWSWLATFTNAYVAFQGTRGFSVVIRAVYRPILAVCIAMIPAVLLVLFVPIGPVQAILKISIGMSAELILYYKIMSYLDPEAIDLLKHRLGAKFIPFIAKFRRKRIAEPPELAGSHSLLEPMQRQ